MTQQHTPATPFDDAVTQLGVGTRSAGPHMGYLRALEDMRPKLDAGEELARKAQALLNARWVRGTVSATKDDLEAALSHYREIAGN